MGSILAMRIALVLAALLAVLAVRTSHACDAGPDRLIALHAKVIRAHLDSDVDALLEDESEDYMLVDRGQVLRPSIAERRAFLGPYLAETEFQEYRDVTPPIVRVSADGSLGWVIVSVRARGMRTRADGTRQPLDFTSAWIELYEKTDGRWLRTGNVSNFSD